MNCQTCNFVLQKFEMKGSPADIELHFLKEFSSLRKSICEIPYKIELSPTTPAVSTLQVRLFYKYK